MVLDPTDFPGVFSPGEMLDTSLCMKSRPGVRTLLLCSQLLQPTMQTWRSQLTSLFIFLSAKMQMLLKMDECAKLQAHSGKENCQPREWA